MGSWPKKATRPALAAHRVYNPHGLLLDGEPAIHWRPYERRMVRATGWHLFIKGRAIAGAHFTENGGKTFSAHGSKDKGAALAEAQAFAEKLLGRAVVWVRSPWGDYVPVEAAERAAALVADIAAGDAP